MAGAIADPVRREILEMLRADARLSAGQIAERFAISRPAVSRHLRVLRESGLVRDELVGRQRFYVLDASRLTPLARWLADFGALDRTPGWAHRLDALETEVYRTRRARRTGRPGVDGPPVDRSRADHPSADGSPADESKEHTA